MSYLTIAAALGADISVGWKLALTAIFVALNGYFVAAEFALVKVRSARVEAAAHRGKRGAIIVQQMLGRMDQYLSACQLGITIASLVLGYLAEPAVATLLIMGAKAAGIAVGDTGWIHMAALIIALVFITILHMTIGEQAPKVFALREPERVAYACALPLKWFELALRPLIVVVNVISNFLLRMIGVTGSTGHGDVHDVNELRGLLRAASQAGYISSRQRTLTENIFGLIKLEVRHIMLPRVDVTFLTLDAPLEDNLRVIRESRHTRLPICDPDLDNVIGMIHGKDVLSELLDNGREGVDLTKLARELRAVPDTQPIVRFILDCQREQAHVALVIDEHGTAVGLAFMEDALEEIVGPIRDEFDQKTAWIETEDDKHVLLAGSVPLPEAAQILGLEVDAEEETIGGYVIKQMGRIPEQGDIVEIGPYEATIVTMSKRRIARVRFDIDEVPGEVGETKAP